MIVERITVEHWRSFVQKHSFTFGEGLNLLTGENEAGKSTVFEVLWRTLFDRHNSSAGEIRDIQPLGTSLAPSSSVEFVQAGKRYRLNKKFLNRPSSELWEEKNGSFSLIHEGDRADARAIEIIGGTGKGKGASKEYNRGISHALWYLQRERPLPENGWNEAIRRGLGSVVQKVTSTPLEEMILKLVDDGYRDIFTLNGKPKESSELLAAERRSSELEQDLSLLLERKSAVQEYRDSIDSIISTLSEVDETMSKVSADIAAQQNAVTEAGEVESAMLKLEAGLEKTGAELSGLERQLADVRKRNSEIEDLRTALEEIQRKQIRNEVDVGVCAKTRLDAHERWHDRMEPELKETESMLLMLTALERLRKLEKDRARLGAHISRKTALAERVRSERKVLEEVHAPSEEEWADYVEKEGMMKIAEAEVRASAIRVSFRLKDSSMKINPSPNTARLGEEYSVDRPTTFSIEGVGEVDVKGGGKSLEEARDGAEMARAEVLAVLRRYSVESTAGLASLLENRRKVESFIRDTEMELRNLIEEEPDAEGEYSRVERGIAQESAKTGDVPADYRSMGGQKIRELADSLVRRKSELISSIERAQLEESEAEKREDALLSENSSLKGASAEINAKMTVLGNENARTLSQFGTMQLLEERAEALRTAFEEERARLNVLKADYRTKVEEPRKRLSEAEDTLSALKERKESLDYSMMAIRANIEAAAGENLHSRIADLEAEINYNSSRLRSLRRRADAHRLLMESVSLRRKELSSELTMPVAALVSSWFDTITGGKYEGVEIDSDLLPTGARRAAGGSLPLHNLSHGTQEQVVVLVRLALGVLASGEERNLVVLDDRLVNADPERFRRLAYVLQEASKKCQILLATCNQPSYSGVSSRLIQVPGDGIGSEATA